MDMKLGTFECIDEVNNAWKCRICGFIEVFEADGPYENGWNICPYCATPIIIDNKEEAEA